MSIFASKSFLCKLTMAVLCLPGIVSCSSQQVWKKLNGSVWNTSYNIEYRSERLLDDSIIAEMRRVELILSPFDPESEISRVNRGERDILSPEAARVFEASQRINRLSGGLFDPTVAPLVNLWGFGYKREYKSPGDSYEAPSQAAIDSALALVGISRCALTPDGHLIKAHPATEFDFSAIAKGYGVDRVAEVLKRCGAEDFLVEIGGECRAGGLNKEEEPWLVRIDSPGAGNSVPGSGPSAGTAVLRDKAIATSGNYRNYHDLTDGRRVGHTISPLTGQPIQSEILSATVIADDCMTADALATACMAMPLDQARAMLTPISNVAAMLIVARDGKPTCIFINKWPQ